MSASTQQATGTVQRNGHSVPRKARSAASIAKQKATAAKNAAAKLAAAPTQVGTPPANVVAARRIGPVPVTAPIASGAAPLSLAWLLSRQQALEIEGGIIRQMIAAVRPRNAQATNMPGKPRKKKAKRRAVVKQAA